jgi:hypothetical protein
VMGYPESMADLRLLPGHESYEIYNLRRPRETRRIMDSKSQSLEPN